MKGERSSVPPTDAESKTLMNRCRQADTNGEIAGLLQGLCYPSAPPNRCHSGRVLESKDRDAGQLRTSRINAG
jgi:hypothetical protein